MDGILQGGRLQQFTANWKRILGETWATSVVAKGYQIQWSTKPTPWRSRPLTLSQRDMAAADEAVKKFLKAGVIERSPSQN